MAKLAATTFAGLDRFLGRKDSRTIGNNTTAERVDADIIVVRLHGHHIATLDSLGTVTIRDAGWQTVTTKDRVNQFLPAPFRVNQTRWVWSVTNTATGVTVPWEGSFTAF